MLKKYRADYHGLELWVEQFTKDEWKIWIVARGKSADGKTWDIKTPEIKQYRSERDAKRDVTTWARREYLALGGHPNPAIEGHLKTGHR